MGEVPVSAKQFIAQVIQARNGEMLGETQSIRADSLIRFWQRASYRNDPRFVVRPQLQDSYKGYLVGDGFSSSREDGADYYRSIMKSSADSIPDGLKGPIETASRMQVANPNLTDGELGNWLDRQHSALANGLRSRWRVADKLYRSRLHEREAYAVGDQVERDYEVLQSTLSNPLVGQP